MNADDPPETDEEGSVLSPNELDIAESDHVVELGESRYVVSASDDGPTEQRLADDERRRLLREAREQSSPQSTESASATEVLRRDLAEAETKYGFHVTAKFDRGVEQSKLLSNDVSMVFENLLTWYARQVDPGIPVEDVLGILLLETNAPIRYPPRGVRRLVSQHGLSREDRIGDLLDAVDGAAHDRESSD